MKVGGMVQIQCCYCEADNYTSDADDADGLLAQDHYNRKAQMVSESVLRCCLGMVPREVKYLDF